MPPVSQAKTAKRCMEIIAALRQNTADTTWRAALGMARYLIAREFKLDEHTGNPKKRTKTR